MLEEDATFDPADKARYGKAQAETQRLLAEGVPDPADGPVKGGKGARKPV